MECWHGMSLTEQTIGTWLADDELPLIVRDLFADVSPAGVAAALREMEVRLLGAAIDRTEMFGAGVGCVHGGRLPDGRRVVVKLHAPRVSVPFLEAMQEVQRHLSADGFPCPQPLAGPLRFERATATAESLLDRGTDADAHEPAVRRLMAATLAWLIERCRPLARLDALRDHPMRVAPGALWPVPHEPRFDFEATSAGAEWIDRIAAEALAVPAAGDWVVGHADWRVEHLRFERGAVSAVYDWDSVHIDREPALVGAAAYAFTANWSREDLVYLPTLEEALAFVADYEQARGAPFTGAEHRVARASLVYRMGYSARCGHSDAMTDMGRRPPRPGSSPEIREGTGQAFLAAHAAELLSP
jgi:hypothetical protein